MPTPINNLTEWLEPDGLGGFASGTTSGERTRRYHALLLAATRPPTGRMVLVNGFDAWVETTAGKAAISTQRYAPDVVYPDGASRLVEFNADRWPRWTYKIDAQTSLVQELFVPHGIAACCVRWTLSAGSSASLTVRPLLSGRDYHSLHHENPAFGFNAAARNGWLIWHPYDGVPGICALTNANYSHEPEWYRNFLYEQEQDRGLDCIEDLASPGTLRWNLSQSAVIILASEGADALLHPLGHTAEDVFHALAERERKRREKFTSPLHRSADAYLVRRRSTRRSLSSLPTCDDDSGQGGKSDLQVGNTIIAGYPWFTDWGRDTFISLRGLCLATGRIDEALQILLAWSSTVSEGMLPNRFPDAGDEPEFNSVDASLWFIIAVHDLLAAAARQNRPVASADRQTLEAAILAIVEGYAHGTRYNIHLDRDSLLTAGQAGVQLTWMDAKVGEWVVTPRIGKPVEIQALWLNALSIASQIDARWNEPFEKGRDEFRRRFWNASSNCLFDVVDVDHQPGTTDAAIRPNQILAVGGLPLQLLAADRAQAVVQSVEQHLLTPVGLRTLAPGSPNYVAHYHGDARQRDGAYHQGVVWPWLIGPFVEAWLRGRNNSPAAKAEVREKFLPPLEMQLQTAGLGHISEIADAEPPLTPRGCPFQAWSLGELLRLKFDVLAE
jgi:predicted glycogen debranching enzyme